jgi:predicted nucleotidyltransferase component of viral defense system
MDEALRKIQYKALDIFSKTAEDFALTGGTALELYYLKHRFSADLDFFSPQYSQDEIAGIISAIKKNFAKSSVKLEAEFTASSRARVNFFTIAGKGIKRPLKIDFVEDVIFDKPQIKRFKGVRVYSINNIYFQKITAITGTQIKSDDIGREITEGRKEARDAFDIYVLSKKIQPLHIFLKTVPALSQRGMVHWYRTFSRQDLKLDLQDLDIYDKKFNSREMIIYLENEIKHFIEEVLP